MSHNLSMVSTALLHLLGSGLNGVEVDIPRLRELSESEWDSLFSLASRQDVAAVVSDILSQTNGIEVPFEVKMKFSGMQVVAERIYGHHAQALLELVRFFNQRDIPTMIIKGISLSRYYPIPQHRSSSDVDIYQYGHYLQADQLVSSYFEVDVRQYEVSHHTNYTFRGVGVENHYHFVTVYYGGKSVELEHLLEDEARKCSTIGLNKERVAVPSATFNAIYLICHMAGHFKESCISLRQMVDWMLFLKKEYDSVDWQRVWGIFEIYHLGRFANAVNGILVKYLCMPSDYAYNYVDDDELEKKIINDVMNSEKIDGGASLTRRVAAEWKQYVIRGWKYRVFDQNGLVEMMKKICAYIRHPNDFKERVIISGKDAHTNE